MTTGLVVTDREKAIDFIEKLIKDYHDKGYNKALEDVLKLDLTFLKTHSYIKIKKGDIEKLKQEARK